MTTTTSPSAAIRARLTHPVIDADGHTIEFVPAFLDYLRQVGGPKILERYGAAWEEAGWLDWYRMSWEERRDRRATRPIWWALPTKNTLDRATATLPKLLSERLEETGLDFTILYPSVGLLFHRIQDEEVRRACCRAMNRFHADLYREQAARMTPAAVIPMYTPQEALEEMEYAVKALGMKVFMMADYALRPIPTVARQAPEVAHYARWLDTFCLDSAYDYDPVWAKCVELQVAPTFHGQGIGWGSRTSISNFMYNHLGHFAAAGEALCKALFMGGVTRRFPTLKFAFLECGVGWACSLYADMIGHWEKRNLKAMENYNPANLNRELLVDLYRRHGGKMVADRFDQVGKDLGLLGSSREDPAMLDEWAPCGITQAEDIRELFVPHFYFGCEADDPINAWAFNTKVNPFKAKLRAIFSSDIGHWDVPDMREVVAEAYELVEKGLLTAEDFREFVFVNPVTLWTGMNPAFFKGTAVEKEVDKLFLSSR
jgi:predicted TIM-barrel fold metal-dependent hydrolase